MAGRPEAQINWKLVDKLLESGANGVDVAGHLGIHPNTLYNACIEEHNCNFSEYSQEKKSSGNALLHVAQFNKAMKGDSNMLKHLGEWRLGQRSKKDDQPATDVRERIVLLESLRAFAKSTNNTELERFIESLMETQQSILDQGPHWESDQVQPELGSEGAL